MGIGFSMAELHYSQKVQKNVKTIFYINRYILTPTENLTALAITTFELSIFSILVVISLTKNQKKVLM